nr:MAG TPA_asm: hypothetical protein [Caudoviricetes sp.]DAS69802.1 MAG TPA: hypothetical protein [Caudoviricetes sp.]
MGCFLIFMCKNMMIIKYTSGKICHDGFNS